MSPPRAKWAHRSCVASTNNGGKGLFLKPTKRGAKNVNLSGKSRACDVMTLGHWPVIGTVYTLFLKCCEVLQQR